MYWVSEAVQFDDNEQPDIHILWKSYVPGID